MYYSLLATTTFSERGREAANFLPERNERSRRQHTSYTWTRTANIAAPEFLDFGLIGEAVGQVRDFTL
jgi:hypothetical protein